MGYPRLFGTFVPRTDSGKKADGHRVCMRHRRRHHPEPVFENCLFMQSNTCKIIFSSIVSLPPHTGQSDCIQNNHVGYRKSISNHSLVWLTKAPIYAKVRMVSCRSGGMADALRSGRSVRKDVRVQISPSAPHLHFKRL